MIPSPTRPPGPAAYGRLMARVGVTPRHRTLRLRERHEVGADRRTISHTTTQTVEATQEEVDRHVAVLASPPGAELRVEAGKGCTKGQLWTDETGLMAFELCFDEVLDLGEQHTFSYTTYLDDGEAPPWFRRDVRSAFDEVCLEICFHTPPATLYRARWEDHDSPPELLEEVEVDEDGSAEALVSNPGPHGLVGFVWSW